MDGHRSTGVFLHACERSCGIALVARCSPVLPVCCLRLLLPRHHARCACTPPSTSPILPADLLESHWFQHDISYPRRLLLLWLVGLAARCKY